MTELVSILQAMASQPKSEQFNIRMSSADREALSKLAQVYKRPMSAVVTDLVRQGIVDYYQDGECFALAGK